MPISDTIRQFPFPLVLWHRVVRTRPSALPDEWPGPNEPNKAIKARASRSNKGRTPLTLAVSCRLRLGSGVSHFKHFHFTVPIGFSMAVNQTHTAIPAQNCFIISCRPNLFRLAVTAHRFLQKHHQGVRWSAGVKLGFGSPLMQESRVIELFVAVGELLKNVLHFGVPIRRSADELICNRQANHAQRQLVSRVYRK